MVAWGQLAMKISAGVTFDVDAVSSAKFFSDTKIERRDFGFPGDETIPLCSNIA